MGYRQIVAILFMCDCISMGAQSGNYKITFNPVFGDCPLTLNDTFYSTGNNDTFYFETLKFYISGIEYLKEDEIVWKEANSYHLIDASDKKSLQMTLLPSSNISFNRIKFNIGIDSITNVSGALGGDLDPTKGMYWTWQSGYINFKLEGKKNHKGFRYHLGGYQTPFNTLQTVVLEARNNDRTEIMIDLLKLIPMLDLTSKSHIMSPGKDAVAISNKISTLFKVQLK